ncbi:MAG: hypothetical protein OEZ03_14380 [Alphaproteobacteria bacterium]|nr:hypothetical protein [Alphaproteobacteria bacterium]
MTTNNLQQDAHDLAALAVFALNHAFRSIADGEGMLVPFVMTDTQDEGRSLHRFVADSMEQSRQRAEDWVGGADSSVARYAFAWDGYVTVDDVKWDAVFVEAGDRVLPHGMLLCQRYRQEFGDSGPQHVVGEPMLVDKPASRLREE